eukprot:COSAG01_NODE_17181_length_1172_cov_3.065238_1_plen_135_part_00
MPKKKAVVAAEERGAPPDWGELARREEALAREATLVRSRAEAAEARLVARRARREAEARAALQRSQTARVSQLRRAQEAAREAASDKAALLGEITERLERLTEVSRVFLRVHWVAVPQAMRARRVNRGGASPRC